MSVYVTEPKLASNKEKKEKNSNSLLQGNLDKELNDPNLTATDKEYILIRRNLRTIIDQLMTFCDKNVQF